MISVAYAQDAVEPMAGGGFISMLPLILIFVVFYFLLIRPQHKRMKAHQEMLKNIKRGDKIVTNGGIVGTVEKIVDDAELHVKIAEGLTVNVLRSGIANLYEKPLKAANDSSDTKKEKNKQKA